MGAGGSALLALSAANLIHPYPADGLSLALGNTGGGDLQTAATSSAYIVLFGANEPSGGSGGVAGDIYAGALKLGQNVTGGTITTLDTNEALTITSNGIGAIGIGTDNTARAITIGQSNTSSTLALTGGDDWSVSTAGLATFGVSGNAFAFNPSSGPTYSGTARPTKRVTLTPEYVGATITGDGSSNTGSMTSDNMTSSPYRNFYKWLNTQGTAQDYDVWVRVPLPADFSAMAATPTLSIDTYTSDTTNGTVLVTVYDTAGTADCSSVAFTPTSTTTWQTKTATTCLDTGTYTANGVMTLDIKLTGAATTGDTRISTISFDYLAKF